MQRTYLSTSVKQGSNSGSGFPIYSSTGNQRPNGGIRCGVVLRVCAARAKRSIFPIIPQYNWEKLRERGSLATASRTSFTNSRNC